MVRVVLLALLFSPLLASAAEWRGNVSADYLWFVQESSDPRQEKSYASLAFEPEFIHDWNDGYDLFTFKPFYRVDQHDEERTHGDIRELSWLHAEDDWEIVVGIGKVFWGVTESIHLVDIINQSDTVENLDGEDKLGQPMIQYTLIKDWGVLSAFVLPGFRERTFPGEEGRPRAQPFVDSDDPEYESDDEKKHVDFALRYTHTVGDWDIGLAHFSGTTREPRFRAISASMTSPPTSLRPVYEQIDQTSLDLQATIEDWLWKLEAISRNGQGDRYFAAAGGFEYTFVGVFESDMDIGMIAEYLYDDRDATFDPTGANPFAFNLFQDDLVIGARLTLNDAQSTEVLASIIEDLDDEGTSYNVEASRRFGDDITLSLEVRGVTRLPANSSLQAFARDNRVRLELAWYF